MLEYESLYEFFKSLGVLNNSNMHWSNIASWVLDEFMYMQVQNTIIKAIQFAKFIAYSCNKVTIIDNGSWICVHAYMVDY
jgi:hypothetical protein